MYKVIYISITLMFRTKKYNILKFGEMNLIEVNLFLSTLFPNSPGGTKCNLLVA